MAREARNASTITINMAPLLRYFAQLNKARLILWCYLIWYCANVALCFDARPGLWITSMGLSAIIGFALLLSTTQSSTGTTKLDRWQVFRLFLMPFCVSSFAALVKDRGYFLVFPPKWWQNLIAFGGIALFLYFCWWARKKFGGVATVTRIP